MTAPTTVLEPGTLARLTADTGTGPWKHRAGTQFEIEEYVPAEEAEDGKAFYLGSTPYGAGDVEADADKVEVVMTAEAAGARTIPTVWDVAREVSSALHSMDSAAFKIDDTDFTVDGAVHAYGQTAEGLRFGFTVQVSGLHRTDF